MRRPLLEWAEKRCKCNKISRVMAHERNMLRLARSRGNACYKQRRVGTMLSDYGVLRGGNYASERLVDVGNKVFDVFDPD